jgi:SagB-type dehydrogenase family enzyme
MSVNASDGSAPEVVVELPPVRALDAATVLGAIAARRSHRAFDPRPLEPHEVAALCWAAQGTTSAEGLRAAPAAGGIHAVALAVADAGGVWSYLPLRHALARVVAEDRRPWLAQAALGQEFVAHAPAVLVLSSDPGALAPRYGIRAERYATLEAGHACENVLLAAVALGLAAAPVAAFSDGAVEEAAALGAGRVPMYLVPVGAPPRAT